jgi:small redox-active disulfide protein 2
MKIEVLGTGCPKCKKLEELVRKVAQENNCDCEIEKVTDINKIMAAGVMMTPALTIDGKVVLSGKLPTEDELKKLIIPNC